MTTSPSPADPSPPAPPARPPATGWQRFKAETIRLFHQYANWLVSISWKTLLRVFGGAAHRRRHPAAPAAVQLHDRQRRRRLAHTPSPSSRPCRRRRRRRPAADALAASPPGGREPGVKIEKKDSKGGDVVISIDRDGVRISPHVQIDRNGVRIGPGAVTGGASGAASGPRPGRASRRRVPRRASTRAAASRSSCRPARQRGGARGGRGSARRGHRGDPRIAGEGRGQQEAAEERAAAAEERASADEKVVRTVRRMRDRKLGDFLTDLAWLIIIASAILKITYKRTIQAEVKAAVATETADSEQLKRQVVEARMAAMQAQVEPHFLFNTLASIDHLIETDPPRASTMQKNLIALLRASMPSMRDSNPAQHALGREMAVIRPYLEILKVRMEDRLQATINVPEGLLSAEFPPMMIQSLVENAIKHGLEPKAEGGTLAVSAEIVHGRLAVTVADTGLGFGRADTAGTGIGLANIRERLKLLYGDKASMVVADNLPSGTVVTITVPYQAL
jgi:signal transduction histidine kinase